MPNAPCSKRRIGSPPARRAPPPRSSPFTRRSAAACRRQKPNDEGVPRMRIFRGLILGAVALIGASCAHYPENARLASYDGQSGYRFKNLGNVGNSDSLRVFLAFSGGGTRAAALSYGVLEELANTPIIWEG